MAGTAGSWNKDIKPIRNGESVSAGTANRPLRRLEERTQYLKSRLDGLSQLSAVIAWDQPLCSDVLVGQPVFWDEENQRWDAAFADAMPDGDGNYVATASSRCRGIVLDKPSANSAHVVLYGIVPLELLTNALDGDVVAGVYYLSAVTPGKLTTQRPPVSCFVCEVLGPTTDCSDLPYAYVAPQLREFQFDHTHYRFALACYPAGTTSPPAEGDEHVITAADETRAGWLPADHESFGGHAPTGAAFGYNLSADPALSRVWPPVPLSAVSLLWDKGQSRVGGTEVPLGIDGLVVVDMYGIWWMSDCYGDVPWPVGLDTSASSSDSSSAACPRTEQMRLSLIFLRNLLGASKAVVTSLTPVTDSPIRVVNCDGDVASTGDLFISLDLDAATVDDADADSGLVVKSVDSNLKVHRGLVVAGIKAGSDQVTLTSTTSRLSDPDDEDSVRIHQGLVTIDLDPSPGDRALAASLVRLGDAAERTYRDFPYIGFAEGRSSGVSSSYNVPYAGLPTSPKVKIRLQLVALATGTLPSLTLGYKRVTRPDGTATPSSVPASLTSLTLTTGVAVTAGDVIEIDSSAFDVTAGDKVLAQLTRAATGGYLGEVGILRMDAILYSGA